MVITERQEAVLSYFVGLGPVGSEVSYWRKELLQDLRILPYHNSRFHRDMQRLVDVRALTILGRIAGGQYTTLQVLARPEAYTVVPDLYLSDWWMSPKYARLEDFQKARQDQLYGTAVCRKRPRIVASYAGMEAAA